jgi:hypothetical protein
MKNHFRVSLIKPFILLGCFLLFSILAFSQDEVSDEFEFQDSGIEINSSKESIRPQGMEMEGAPSVSDAPFESSSNNAEDTVLVRTRAEAPATNQQLSPAGLVEVRTSVDVFLPYKQRQNDWGFLFSLGEEKALFPGYYTLVGIENGDDYTFEEMFGSEGLDLLSLELGPKYNTRLGSFALLFGYGYLSAASTRIRVETDPRYSVEAKITYSRYTATGLYYLDMLFEEPYLIPYVGAGIWQANITETSGAYKNITGHYNSDVGTQFKVGALFGLDWIESDAARINRKKSGTQGSFLNIYGISTFMSEKNALADLENDMDFGASLVIEF